MPEYEVKVTGGKLILEGDKKEYEAMGHCSAYSFHPIQVCDALLYTSYLLLLRRVITKSAQAKTPEDYSI